MLSGGQADIELCKPSYRTGERDTVLTGPRGLPKTAAILRSSASMQGSTVLSASRLSGYEFGTLRFELRPSSSYTISKRVYSLGRCTFSRLAMASPD